MSWLLFYKTYSTMGLTENQRKKLLFTCSIPQGPSTGKIAFVGEAPGENEEKYRDVFSGGSGKELRRICADAGLDIGECLLTNVFMERPPANDVEYFFEKGRILRPEFQWHLPRLRAELVQFNPNVIVALGGTPLWALTGQEKITKSRGSALESHLLPGKKVLPTFHPAFILRKWDARVILLADILTAIRESATPELSYPDREIWIPEKLDDIWHFNVSYLQGKSPVAFDIETTPLGGDPTISCISLAPDPLHALVIPFWDGKKNYWPEMEEEIVLGWLRRFFANPEVGKVGQNGIFDIQYLRDEFKIEVYGYNWDTLVLHHAWQPELPKSLAFLGSVYTNERSWKWMRPKGMKSDKRDE